MGLAVLHPARTRQSVDHPKCGIDLLLSPLPLNVQNVELCSGAFQSKSGSAQRNTSVQHFGRTRTRRHAAEGNPKTMGFWRRSFPHFFRCWKKWGRRRHKKTTHAGARNGREYKGKRRGTMAPPCGMVQLCEVCAVHGVRGDKPLQVRRECRRDPAGP